ncbi:hypothetical protein [Pseudomonas putida]|uniref:hypothetical protein n=1 Tax=Pseudomonas putida TaxID=303 RepID=UPI0015FC369A|nr:hypothetical protein [Pseudomonas putida]
MISYSSSAAMAAICAPVQYPTQYGVKELRRVLKKNPDLSSNGFITHRTRDCFERMRVDTFKSPRFALEFDDCCRVLATAKRVKTPTVGSYGLKHTVERLVGNYISNGALICAAIALGFTTKHSGPNVLVGVSMQTWRAWQKQSQCRGWVERDQRPADWDFGSTKANE